MQLLVSVANAREAAAALAGGADVIDAKDPHAGALGAVRLDVFHAVATCVAGARPVSAALGDAGREIAIEQAAAAYGGAGAGFVKVGFAGITSPVRVEALMRAAVRGAVATGARVIAVAYADGAHTGSIAPLDLIEVAAHAGAAGVLLDTADKQGPALPALVTLEALRTWVRRAHDRRLLAALAGRLTADDLPLVRDAGADVAGVRGAACAGTRTSAVTSSQVRRLRGHLDRTLALDLATT